MISSSLTFYRDQKHHDAKIQGEQNLNNLNEDNKWKPDKKKNALSTRFHWSTFHDALKKCPQMLSSSMFPN